MKVKIFLDIKKNIFSWKWSIYQEDIIIINTHIYIHTPNEKHNEAKYDEAKMDKTEEIDISKYNRLPLTPHFQ